MWIQFLVAAVCVESICDGRKIFENAREGVLAKALSQIALRSRPPFVTLLENLLAAGCQRELSDSTVRAAAGSDKLTCLEGPKGARHRARIEPQLLGEPLHADRSSRSDDAEGRELCDLQPGALQCLVVEGGHSARRASYFEAGAHFEHIEISLFSKDRTTFAHKSCMYK